MSEDDKGFSIMEVLITLALVSAVFGMSLGLLRLSGQKSENFFFEKLILLLQNIRTSSLGCTEGYHGLVLESGEMWYVIKTPDTFKRMPVYPVPEIYRVSDSEVRFVCGNGTAHESIEIEITTLYENRTIQIGNEGDISWQ